MFGEFCSHFTGISWRKFSIQTMRKMQMIFMSLSLCLNFCQTKLHSPSLTWNPKVMVSKRNVLLQGAIFRFHVKLWEGRRWFLQDFFSFTLLRISGDGNSEHVLVRFSWRVIASWVVGFPIRILRLLWA